MSPQSQHSQKGVVLTGMRTTGGLHLGHYVGALENWLAIQNAGQHECFFLLADLQALTTHANSPQLLHDSVMDVALDWLAVGLDPEAIEDVNFVLQSQVRGRSDLSLYFQMIARYSEVMRNPTLKAELESQENATMGFLTYPVDQVADIHMVDALDGRQLLVPVGQDQVPHLEYSRELARRMNFMYGTNLQPCEALVGTIGRLVGTDGNDKMSKSKGNAINLSDSPDEVRAKIKKMYSSPRASVQDPGDPDKSIVFQYLRAFDPDQEVVEELALQYRHGGLGDAVIKNRLTDALNTFLTPIRQRRAVYANDLGFVRDIIMDGTGLASTCCSEVVDHVGRGMYLGLQAG